MRAEWRKIEPTVGALGWLIEAHNHTPGRTPFRVLSISEGGMVLIVEIPRGASSYEKRLYSHHVDCGREYRTRSGDWIHESDPRVRRWLVRAIADIEAGGSRIVGVQDRDARARMLDDLIWVLGRSSRYPPTAPASRER